MAAARARARHTSRTRCTRSCPQTFQCPARACSPAPPRVNARKRTKPPTTTTTTTTTNLLPGAVVYVAVSILENALTVLQVIQPLSLVHVTARKRFLALPAYYTASRTHHTSHITRHTSHVTRHTSHITRHTSPQRQHAPLPPVCRSPRHRRTRCRWRASACPCRGARRSSTPLGKCLHSQTCTCRRQTQVTRAHTRGACVT